MDEEEDEYTLSKSQGAKSGPNKSAISNIRKSA
jgi:hypothetical protein